VVHKQSELLKPPNVAATKHGEKKGSKEDAAASPSRLAAASPLTPSSATEASPAPTILRGPLKEELVEKALKYMPSVLDPDDTSFDRMICPPIDKFRYFHLKPSKRETKQKYFFALNLRQCVDLLPRLMSSVLEAIQFLGPEHCALSIIEGNSNDGTLEVLELLKEELDRMGTPYFLRRSELNPGAGERIERLAALRAMAVEPITGVVIPEEDDANSTDTAETASPPIKLDLAPGATVLFLNDVAACAEDILELAHQRIRQGADMTCAMDWTHPGNGTPYFYDVWIARTLGGDTFFDIPNGTGSWDHATHLFPWEPVTRARLAAGLPFQVFACWNGAVAFVAAPVADGDVRFRSAGKGECFQGEPQLFCKDMWYRGRGRIAVVPSVNLQYTDALGRRVKGEKGYVSDWVGKEGKAGVPPLHIDWKLEPPAMVKCMPLFHTQSWLPWNESLPQ